MNQTNMKNTLKSNVIKLQENPLYIKKLVKGKSLNFGSSGEIKEFNFIWDLNSPLLLSPVKIKSLSES